MTAVTGHILIAEDDTFLTEIMQKSLGSHNVRVSVVQDGQAAIDVITATPPDMLLLDLLMPQVDGFAVLEHMKAMNHSFPVIVLSNLSDDVHKKKCAAFNVSEYFVKSDMNEDQLWPIVQKYLPAA